MAINAYVGLQGSGKSYEVVSSVILDAVLHGRRVVTNVAGIDEDKIHEYLVNQREAEPGKLGKIVHVTNDQVMQPGFFPDEETPDVPSVVKGGDMVAVDEAWRFWGTDGGKLSHEHMQFFRMHRHYVHPDTAVACDVVLMTQDIASLHRSVKNVIEFTFKMHKHKALGLTKCYRVEIYEGWKINTKTRIDDRQKKYNPEIFPLYQSYTGGQGMERAIDKRQNVFANRTLWMYALGVIVMMIIGGTSAWRFFHRKEDAKSIAAPIVATNVGPAVQVASPAVKVSDKLAFSDAWRIVGEFSSGVDRWIVVANQVGRVRVESPSMFHGRGSAIVGEIDGERVSRWSGSLDRTTGMLPTGAAGK